MAAQAAEEVGERLLAEVKSEGLDELLNSLHDNALQKDESKNWLGIPALDRLIRVFDRQSIHPPVIEITSVAPASGKTHLLYLLATIATLPDYKNFGRRRRFPGCVVVFDTDDRFDVERLAQVMHHQLHSASPYPTESNEETMAIIRNALQHVHIFRPQSLASLVATVRDLPRYLFAFNHHMSRNRSLDLVLLDTITAYFWQEKLAEETARSDGDAEQVPPRDNGYLSLIRELRELKTTFGCSIVAASWGLSPTSSVYHSKHSPSFRPLLPPAWQSFCTLRLVVGRDNVRQFPFGMTIEQARRDASDRQKIVNQGKFTIWVDEWNREIWSAEMRESFRAHSENRAFWFRITPRGIDIDK